MAFSPTWRRTGSSPERGENDLSEIEADQINLSDGAKAVLGWQLYCHPRDGRAMIDLSDNANEDSRLAFSWVAYFAKTPYSA
jgi:hypothetical protein